MRSKTLSFNPTLFKKNLTRFWPLWGGASFVGALFPLAFLMFLIQDNSFLHKIQDPLEITMGYYHVAAYILPVLSLLYAVLCALAAWGWLFNARSVGMYHSLPITRLGLFVTSFLSGLTMMLIPYAVTGALSILVSASVGGVEPAGLLVTILSVLGESFFFFASATLAVFITGNPFAFAAFYFLFHFIAAGAEWLVSRLMTMFYFGVTRAYDGVVEFLSPVLYLIRKLEVDAVYRQIPTRDGWIEYGDLESVTLVNGWLIAVYALVGVVLLACAWALYRRRRSECAGDVVAVGWMKPVFRYGVALCAALTGGMILYNFLFDSFQTGSTAAILPMTLCMIFSGVIGYYIASMLLAKSLRVFRGSWKGAAATVLAAGALCLAIAADPFVVETWAPRAEEVQSVSLFLYGRYGRGLSANLEDPAAIRQILDAHQAILSERKDLDRPRSRGSAVSLDLTYFYSDGKTASRSYTLPFSQELLEESEALGKTAALMCSPNIQEVNIFGEVYNDSVKSRLVSASLDNVYSGETRTAEMVTLTLEQGEALEAAVRRDIQAGHFGKALFLPNDEYRGAVYYGGLNFYYNVTRLDSGSSGGYNSSVYLSLSTYCTETLQTLEDLGIIDSTRRLLTLEQQDALEEGALLPEYGDPDSFPDSGSVVYPADAYVYPGEEVDAALLH